MSDYTPRQLEFRDRLSSLIEEYADAIGPDFPGHQETVNLGNPVLDCWLIGMRWVDLDDHAGAGAVVRFDSGLNAMTGYGMAHTLVDMLRDS